MKNVFIFFLLFNADPVQSQKLFTSFFAGISGYQGDLQEKPFSIRGTNAAFGIGFLYELNDLMLIRTDFTFGKISGDDKLSVKNRARNLSFFSNISEISLGFEYLPVNLYNYKVSPYLFTGISGFSFSPKAKNINGDAIALYELSTEGQGFYQNRKRYKLRQISIPFGGGLQWAISDNVRAGIVIGIRKTFTDYLDDVSTTYIDPAILAMRRNQTAVTYAYRGDELPNGDPYPPEGTKRGSPANKDWYMFSGLTLRVRVDPKGKKRTYTFRKRTAKITCPRIF